MTRGGNMLKVYHNLLLHNGKWYALAGPGADGSEELDTGVALNTAAVVLPVADAAAFLANLQKARRPRLACCMRRCCMRHAACGTPLVAMAAPTAPRACAAFGPHVGERRPNPHPTRAGAPPDPFASARPATCLG
jgi:hypothetical protein